MKKYIKIIIAILTIICLLSSSFVYISAASSEEESSSEEFIYRSIEAKYLTETLKQYVNSGAQSAVFFSQDCVLSTGENGYCRIGYNAEASSFYVQILSTTNYYWSYKFDLDYVWKHRVAYHSDDETWETVDGFAIKFKNHNNGNELSIDDLDSRCRLLFKEIEEEKIYHPISSEDLAAIRTSFITNLEPSRIIYSGWVELSTGEFCNANFGWSADVNSFYIQPLTNNPSWKWAYKFADFGTSVSWAYRDINTNDSFTLIDDFSIKFIDKNTSRCIDCPSALTFLFEHKEESSDIIPEGQYSIIYDANGGTFDDGESTLTKYKVHGNDHLITSNKPTRSGYTFIGWAVRNSGNEIVFSDDQDALDSVVCYVEYMESGDYYEEDKGKTFYAIWQENEYSDAGLYVQEKYSTGYVCCRVFYPWVNLEDYEWIQYEEYVDKVTSNVNGYYYAISYNVEGFGMNLDNDIKESLRNSSHAYSTLLKMPNSQDRPIAKIKERGFEGCNTFNKIILPETLIYIGDYAFYNCSNLKSVYFPLEFNGQYNDSDVYPLFNDDNFIYNSIGDYAFAGCTSLTTQVQGANDKVYYNCVPAVDVIGYKSFDSCPSNLFTVENGIRYLKGPNLDYYALYEVTTEMSRINLPLVFVICPYALDYETTKVEEVRFNSGNGHIYFNHSIFGDKAYRPKLVITFYCECDKFEWGGHCAYDENWYNDTYITLHIYTRNGNAGSYEQIQ